MKSILALLCLLIPLIGIWAGPISLPEKELVDLEKVIGKVKGRFEDIEQDLKDLVEIPPLSEVLQEQGQALFDQLEPGQEVSLLVWNIQYALDPKAYNDLEAFASRVDFALIQESFLDEDFLKTFADISTWRWSTAISFLNKEKVGTGVSTGSAYESSAVNFIRSEVREPGLKSPKMIVINEIPIEGEDHGLLLVNIHAINFVLLNKYKEHIRQMVDAIESHQGPMIVAGDFNTHMLSGRLEYLDEKLETLGLKRFPFQQDDRLLKLDHVYSRGVIIERADILGEIKTSDHDPILVQGRLL